MKTNLAPRSDYLAALLRRLIHFGTAENVCAFCQSIDSSHYCRLLDVPCRNIICACEECAKHVAPLDENYKPIPCQTRALPDFQMTDYQWDGFALPINAAFFQFDTLAGEIVAVYPGAEGAVRAELTDDQWSALREENPVLADMQADVEALLVNRIGIAREYYIAPIDKCLELAERVSARWRETSSGEAVCREIEEFFSALRKDADAQSVNTMEVSHA